VLHEKARELIGRYALAFDILRDPGNEVAASYGLRWQLPEDLKQLYLHFGIDLAADNGDDSWTLPMPARYIIDRDGVVRYARTDPDYTRRPEPEETLEALRALV
jgi:peroxiredoxin